jgi:DNA sulfur modification protein DndB
MLDRPGLQNLLPRSELIGLARSKAKKTEELTVKPSEVGGLEANSWSVKRRGARSMRMVRDKRHDVVLEDRVWSLMWRMGFDHLSGVRGALLTVNPGADHKVTSQIDVLALDDDVCVAVECKSSETRGRRPSFQQELAKHTAVREPLTKAINPPGNRGPKRPLVLVFWTRNALFSVNDRERAREQKVVLFNEQDLDYFEALVQHLGPAARYQFLSELLPGRAIPGLEIRVPALQSKMGAHECYTFSVAPEYLLKIAYVAHRTARDSDVTTYQRMVTRSRLKSIAAYILAGPDSMFPTNIVINLDKPDRGGPSTATFERAKQEEGAEGATFGWLTLRPAYKSAWIIDGQHRLYAYSYAGEEAAARGRLSVLAFDGLPGRLQQKLFQEINGEQKSVKKSLLQQLYSDLHHDADDPTWKAKAAISRAIQELTDDPDSPLFDRVLLATAPRTDTRCITMPSLFGALDKPGFFWFSLRGNQINRVGPFWDSSEDKIVRRTSTVINYWFQTIRNAVPQWWDAGAGEGGGLAMGDGVSIAADVLRSVFDHLDSCRIPFGDMTPKELTSCLDKWARATADYFASMSEDQRRLFRDLRGNQGHATGLRHAQGFIHERFLEFQPEGLVEFLEREKARTNDTAISRINDMERQICRIVIAALKGRYGTDGEAWWYSGVPKNVRTAAANRQEDDQNRRGGKEYYLDFIDYREIIQDNWLLLGELLAPGKQNQNKATRTEWMMETNKVRQIAAHGSSGTYASFEQLDELDRRLSWLREIPTP